MATLRMCVKRSAAAASEESNGNARGIVPARFQFEPAKRNLWLKHRAITSDKGLLTFTKNQKRGIHAAKCSDVFLPTGARIL
jgi:hypothetical protein